MEKYQLNRFEINENKITSFELLTNHNERLINREKFSKCLGGCPSKGIVDEKKDKLMLFGSLWSLFN